MEGLRDGKKGRDAFMAKFANEGELTEHMRSLAAKRGLYSRVGRAVVKTYEEVIGELEAATSDTGRP